MRNIVEFRMSHVARMSFDLTPEGAPNHLVFWPLPKANEGKSRKSIFYFLFLSVHYTSCTRVAVSYSYAGRRCVRAKLSSALERVSVFRSAATPYMCRRFDVCRATTDLLTRKRFVRSISFLIRERQNTKSIERLPSNPLR